MSSRGRTVPLEGEVHETGQARVWPQLGTDAPLSECGQARSACEGMRHPRASDRACSGEGAGPSFGDDRRGDAEGGEEDAEEEPCHLPSDDAAGGYGAAGDKEQRWPEPEWEYHGPGTEAVPCTSASCALPRRASCQFPPVLA